MLLAQTRFERTLTQYQDWLADGAVFLGTLLGFYLLARFLIVPSVVRVVRSRNRNNPTLVNAVGLYLRIVIVVPVAIAAAASRPGRGSCWRPRPSRSASPVVT